MIYIYGLLYVLLATNLVTLILFLRARKLNADLFGNERAVKEWLEVHNSLNRTGHGLLEIRVLDPGSIFYREPTR